MSLVIACSLESGQEHGKALSDYIHINPHRRWKCAAFLSNASTRNNFLLLGSGEGEQKGRPGRHAVSGAFNPDRASMIPYYMPANRQPQPGASRLFTPIPFNAEESFKYPLLVLLRDSRPAVAHSYRYFTALRTGENFYFPPLRTVLQGVFQQIAKDLNELIEIGLHHWSIRWKAVLKRYAPLVRGGRTRLPCLDQRVLGPDRPDIRIGFIVFHFGKLEKVVHYFDYMICVLENNFET